MIYGDDQAAYKQGATVEVKIDDDCLADKLNTALLSGVNVEFISRKAVYSYAPQGGQSSADAKLRIFLDTGV